MKISIIWTTAMVLMDVPLLKVNLRENVLKYSKGSALSSGCTRGGVSYSCNVNLPFYSNMSSMRPCSNGELNTSKAKLRGANYPREKSKTRWFS